MYGLFAQEASDVTGVNESKATSGQELPLDYDNQVIRNLDDDHEWIKHLKSMPKLYDEEKQPLHGWFRMADVLLVMPLEIFCRIVDITEEVRTEHIIKNEMHNNNYFSTHYSKAAPQICPKMQVNEMQALYDKHHEVSSFQKSHQNTYNSVKYEVI